MEPEEPKQNFFGILNNNFAKNLTKDINFNAIQNFFPQLESRISLAFVTESHDVSQRELLSFNLGWLINQLVYISVHDKQRQITSLNIQTQKELLKTAYTEQRWWFYELISAYISLIKQVNHWNGSVIDLKMPLTQTPRPVNSTQLTATPIVISNEDELFNLLELCISSLVFAVPQYCNLKYELGVDAREAMLEVFARKRLPVKMLAVKFVSRYLNTLAQFTDEDVHFFVSVMQTMSLVFKDLPILVQSLGNSDTLKKTQELFASFFKEAPILQMNFGNTQTLHEVITYSSEILFHQLSNLSEPWYSSETCTSLTNMLMNVLAYSDYNLEAVKNLKLVLELDHPTVVPLMKYLIAAEITEAPKFDNKVYNVSPSWKLMLTRLLARMDCKEQSETSYMNSMLLIYAHLELAIQIDFCFTNRIQLMFGLNKLSPYSLGSPEIMPNSQDPLLKFADWDYKHISLHFFENLEQITHKILDALEKKAEYDTIFVSYAIDVFSCILKFSGSTTMTVSLKQILVAVVASPFFKDLKVDPQFNKLAGFQKVMNLLPTKMKSFFEKTIVDSHLQKLKSISIKMLATLEISRINNFCWWLVENIVQLIFLRGDVEVKKALVKVLPNLMINNSDKFKECVGIYDKLLKDFKNPESEIGPLTDVLCLTGGNVLIIKLPSKDHIYNHLVICDDCQLQSTKFQKGACTNEVNRWMGYLKTTNGILISSDRIRQQKMSLQIVPRKFVSQSNDFKVKFIEKIPALLNHSEEFKTWIQQDKARMLFRDIFVEDSNILEQLEITIPDIFNIVQKRCKESKKAIWDNCFAQLCDMTRFTKESPDIMLQSLTVRVNYVISSADPDENMLVKCFKIFLLYIIYNKSQVMGEASLLAMRMAEQNDITIYQLFKWHKTFLMTAVVNLFFTNVGSTRTLSSSLMDLIKSLNFPRLRDFLPSVLDVIISKILLIGVDHPRLMSELQQLCRLVNLELSVGIKCNLTAIYYEIHRLESQEKRDKCLKFIQSTTGMNIRDLIRENRKTVEEALVYYNKSPEFVVTVMQKMLFSQESESFSDEIATNITTRFLGVLIYFEPFLTSTDCERVIKKNILLSLGDIIRLLGTNRVSKYCFKIISVLKVAAEQTSFDLSEICMQVWGILIRVCDVTFLGPILSTIFVSLEVLIEKFPKEVNEIYKYLVVENRSLLSLHIGDLFFIEKTRVSTEIKDIVLKQISSQKRREEVDLKNQISSMLGRMNKENSDVKIRVYCLQYLRELFANNRQELNELICGQMKMDPLIEELLHIIVNNCKSSTSQMLQVATAECFGELGAIDPSLQRQNFSNQKEFPETIHSDGFAKMALAQLCQLYQFKDDAKYIDALSLGVQGILKSRNVTLENRDDHDVWEAIPEKMRPSMESLLSSKYAPRQTQLSDVHPIFWNLAQTASDWALKLAGVLINQVPDSEHDTKYLLEFIKPSMKHNQHTIAMFLPYMFLHYLQTAPDEHNVVVVAEIQWVFDVVLEKETVDREKSECRKPFYVKAFDFVPIESKKKSLESSIKSVAIKVAKIIFESFDFLEYHRRTFTTSVASKPINMFLKNFDMEEMAHVNYKCGEYARAMIYLEEDMKHMDKASEGFQEKLSFLTNIYAKLGSPDSVEGIRVLKKSDWTLEEKILISNITGNHRDSAACFERMMQLGCANMEHIQSMINSFISLDQTETALLVYENMIGKLEDSQQTKLAEELKAEPLWRLSRFDELEKLMEDATVAQSTKWGVRCGQLLLKFRSNNDIEFSRELENTRLAMMKNLKISGSEQTAYGKNYKEIINLHLIAEFEKTDETVMKIKKAMDPVAAVKVVVSLIKDWNTRMEFIKKDALIEEPIHCFHRIILNETKSRLHTLFGSNNAKSIEKLIDGEIGRLWVKSTELACKNEMFQQAEIYILNAESYKPKDLFLKKAKLHWIKKDQNNAFKTLDIGLENLLANRKVESLTKEDKEIYAKGKLRIAKYNAEAVHVDFESNKALFKQALVQGTENEKAYLLYADYMDQFYCTEDKTQNARVGKPSHMNIVMDAYYRSMLFGSEYVFRSMPRFLSIWLDTTTIHNSKQNYKQDIANINRLVEKVVEKLEINYFYTAFSQLNSRICHESLEVFAVLKSIIVKLIMHYPQQSLWFLTPMLKSAHTTRARRCKEILKDARLDGKQVLIHNFNSLMDKFVKLASADLPRNMNRFKVDSIAPDLIKMINGGRNSQPIVMPFQCNLQLVRNSKQNIFKFTDGLVYIQNIKNQAEVMSSLQRPKKVTLIGDDGKEYVMLFKNMDDLRLDFRFQEFCSVIKDFLHKDPESRNRQLTTRTYSVIPLTESSGLIEWVPNLQTYKTVINQQYTKKRINVPKLNEIANRDKNLTKPERIAAFRQYKKQFKPVLGDYYRQQFPTPQNYFNAQLSFIRTTSIMSIIGYIVGLGDRHGENILIDVCSGETFHVDFNMLFNKGESLSVPETVPFRLTHNMIDAMGVLGIEGPFRKNCEIVLRVLQKEKDTLMSYLRPLVYDPMVKNNCQWQKAVEGKRMENERTEKDLIDFLIKTENRLKGVVSKYKGSSEIPLSTEGQVNFIIEEATNEQNLAMMFHGWMPFL